MTQFQGFLAALSQCVKYQGPPYVTLCRLNETGRQLLTIELMIQAPFLPDSPSAKLTSAVDLLEHYFYSAGNEALFTPTLTFLQIE